MPQHQPLPGVIMNSIALKLPQLSRPVVEHVAPLVVCLTLYGMALALPSVGHRMVPLPVLVVHAGTAIASLLLGAFILFRRKGTPQHKALGKTWMALMLVASLTSFAIQSRGHLSAIHLLAIVVPVYLFMGVYFARRGDIKSHLRVMRGLYVGLGIAGVFAMLTPGRSLTHLLFGA